ncbi:M28 family metallopeptidase [Solitalea koreensis]|uniref:Carboxypeptidase Q n=1 Tax=Solitalea koreensis TaxID=543615 RepID=A0A521C5Q0_9SPHI|nr:M20/M25/M40 family metallo-hydrolase [Solitalea koreensis]SMO54723.1 Peptidase family M28 [Solitalea koreensis]
MKKIQQLLILLLFSCAYTVHAQEEKVDLEMVSKIRNEGLNNSKVMDIAFNLTDVSGPRLSGSSGLKNAQNWAQEEFAKWGLHNVQLEPWGDFGRGWEIEKSYAAMTLPYYQPLIGTPKAWTQGTNGLLKGKVVLVTIKMDSDFADYKGKLHDKIVILDNEIEIKPHFTADTKRYEDKDLEEMAAFKMPAQSNQAAPKPRVTQDFRTRVALGKLRDFCKEEGAVLIISGGTRGSDGTYFTSNGASYALDAKAVLPEFEMAAEHYQRILRLLNAGKTVELEFDTKTRFLQDDVKGYNVIAEIPGTDKKLKSELVMLGAHLDSWHAATGATDNGAGSAVVMEAMRILKALNIKPRRTIRVALWSSEEQGLLGSKGYVKAHLANKETLALLPEHEKLSAYYNLDNGTGKIRGIYTQGNTEAVPIFAKWLESFKDLDASTVTLKNTGGTDHLSFDAVGIPGFQFIQDEMDYGTRTHHTNMDTYDRLQADDLKQAATIMATFVYNTAMRNEKMPRKKTKLTTTIK